MEAGDAGEGDLRARRCRHRGGPRQVQTKDAGNKHDDNLKELQVIESKRTAIRKGLVYDLPNAQTRFYARILRREMESRVIISTGRGISRVGQL